MPRAVLLALVTFLTLAALPARADAVRFFAYNPINDATRAVAGDLTFQFKQRLIFTTVLAVRSTEGEATALLKPADEHALGAGGLSRLIGPNAQERDLYEVGQGDQGGAMIHAFCPGSDRAWMAFGRLLEGRRLRVQVIGDVPGGGPARLCHTLDFQFRGEFRLPTGPGVPQREMLVPKFPY